MSITLTTVADVLYKPDGSPAEGRLWVSNTSVMIGPDGSEIPAFTTIVVPAVNGAFSVELVPNLGSTPNGTSYSVKWGVTEQYYREVWVVPESPNPAKLVDVRVLKPPIPDIMIPLEQVLPPSDFAPGDVPEWSGTQWVPQEIISTQSVLTAGMNVNQFQVVYVALDGKAYLASANNLATINVVGIAATSATTGNSFTVQLTGEIDSNGFGFAQGERVYVGDNGALVQAVPGDATYEYPIGTAVSPSRLFVELGLPIVLA